MFTFFAFTISAYFVTDIFKILLAKQLRKKLTPHNILKIKKISSVLLIIFGMVIMAKAFLPESGNNIKIPLTQRIEKK
jgi:putative Ca2+/H+ antiporter (TMEM165/GDT1 family)